MKVFFLIKEGLLGFKRARLAATITIITISLALALIGIFGLLAYYLSDGFQQTYNRINLEVFIDPSLDEAQRMDLQGQINRLDGISAIRYISPEEALQSFQADFGDDMLAVLGGENPLPGSFRVVLKSEFSDLASVQSIVQKIESFERVDDVVFQERLVRLLNEYFFTGIIIAVVLGATIFFISAMLIFNTIRLTIHSRKTLIDIMRLVGATRGFIKAPFIIEGVAQGLIGSLLACGLLWLIAGAVNSFFLPGFHTPWFYYVFIIFTGILLGLMGSYISIGKYLRY